MKKPIFIFALLVAALIVGYGLRPSANETDFNVAGFAELPVQVGGRVNPLDSVARNTLLILAGRQKVIAPDGQTLSPIQWFMDLTMRPEIADTYRVFKIEFPDELGIAGLAEAGQRYYAFNDLQPHFGEIMDQVRAIEPEPRKRTPYEKQIADLYEGLTRYHRVMQSLHPIGPPERLERLTDEYRIYLGSIEPGLKAFRQQQAGEEYDVAALNAFLAFSNDYLKLSETAHLRVIPPPAAGRSDG